MKLDEPFRLDRGDDARGAALPGARQGARLARATSSATSPRRRSACASRICRSGRRLVVRARRAARSTRARSPSSRPPTCASSTARSGRADELLATARPARRPRPRWATSRSAGRAGACALLAGLPGRTFYIHMNNTNPVLDAGSTEAAEVRRAGVQIARTGWSSSCDARRARGAPARASSPSATTTGTRSTCACTAASCTPDEIRTLGAQPLLLPDAHPDQGRDHPREVRGPGVPARVDPPHPRPRRRRRARGRPRALAAARRGGGPRPRARSRRCATCCPACAARATRTCASWPATTCSSGGGVAHRARGGRPHGRAHRGLREALRVGRRRTGLALLPHAHEQAPRDAAEGLGLRARRTRATPEDQARCAAARSSGSARSSGRSSTASSGARARLRLAPGRAAARRRRRGRSSCSPSARCAQRERPRDPRARDGERDAWRWRARAARAPSRAARARARVYAFLEEMERLGVLEERDGERARGPGT